MNKVFLLIGCLFTGSPLYAGNGLKKTIDTSCLLKAFRSDLPICYSFSNTIVEAAAEKEVLKGRVVLSRKEYFYSVSDSAQEQIIGMDAMIFLNHRDKIIRIMRFDNEESRRATFEQFAHSSLSDSLLLRFLRKSSIELFNRKNNAGDSLFITLAAGLPVQQIGIALPPEGCMPEKIEMRAYPNPTSDKSGKSGTFYRSRIWNYQTVIPANLKALFDNRSEIARYLQNIYPAYRTINL